MYFYIVFVGFILTFVGTPFLVDASSIPVTRTSISTSTRYSVKEVALTFDDGPYGTSTDKILGILEHEHVHATFFVVGQNVKKFPEEVIRMKADGDAIGNHSYTHSKNLSTLSEKSFSSELTKTNDLIASTTAIYSHIFRPPFGLLSESMKHVLKKQGYTIIMWSVDPKDWDYKHSPTEDIVKKVLEKTEPGSIILLHDGRDTHINYPRGNTIDALPKIIERLKKEGYVFVTLNEHSRLLYGQ